MDNIIATRSYGRVQLAQDIHWYGSINSYNNGFTRFFAKLFGKAVTVDISGKKHCLNKKSYQKHLVHIGAIASEDTNLHNYTVYRNAINKLDPNSLPKGDKYKDTARQEKGIRRLHTFLACIGIAKKALGGKNPQQMDNSHMHGSRHRHLRGNLPEFDNSKM